MKASKSVAAAVLMALALSAQPSSAQDQAAVARGKYLALAGNCASCHTTADGESMAGGVAFATPFGTVYSTNITPDSQTGIGNWSAAQFLQSMRAGVRPDGEHLYPVFPYTSFTKLTDEDINALYAYLQTVPAVNATAPANEMSFPFNQRALMSLWKMMFFEEGAYQPVASQSAEWNRGAYLVEGPGHCGACHTPRNFLGAEKSSLAMAGGTYTDKVPTGELRPWAAVNLTSAPQGLAHWSVDELAAYLKTGQNGRAATFGPMNEVIMNSTRHLSEADTRAMAVYIKSLPARAEDSGSKANEEVLRSGETLYTVHCGTCHLPTGLGSPDSAPSLAGSAVVQASDPASLINTIMYGPEIPEPHLPNNWDMMEAFGDEMGDEELADLASYLRSAWGNSAGAVTAEQVGRQR